MPVGDVLLDILVVLIAAKVAAELAERVHVPAVVGEILAGILVGPSALGLVGEGDEVLRVLGEIGVILLLLEVGLQMDLAELGAVGRTSLLVALAGVAAPFAMGWASAQALGHGGNAAVFIGAALTATSVGITARVFGDLGVLARVESRTVLGAAVIDDVLGLVILTVVVRLATEGSVSVLSVLAVVGMALAFLVVVGGISLRAAPPLFALLQRWSRSAGTMVAAALAFTLAISELASVARLAPIVGAFVAGLALGRTAQAERVRRELTPVGHLFVPVFFLQIGIDVDVAELARPAALGIAGVLLAVAVTGKLVSAVGAAGRPGDKLTIGLGMIPRGEVGLIFAGLGLREGVLGQDLYGALLLVVLVTTLVTPPLLRWRLQSLEARATAAPVVATRPSSPGGWLEVSGSVVELGDGSPGPEHVLRVALQAAHLAAASQADPQRSGARIGPRLLDWLAATRAVPLRWDREATRQFFALLSEGDVTSWRLLEAVDVLERALPELRAAVDRRRSDPFLLDPANLLRWSAVERVRDLAATDPIGSREYALLSHPEWLLLAALVVETAPEAAVAAARRLAQRLDLGAAAEEELALLVGERELLSATVARVDGLREAVVLPVALHLGTPERARALYLLTLALDDPDVGARRSLDELHRLVQAALSQEDLTGRPVRNLAERRRAQAIRALEGLPVAVARVREAPLRYVLAQEAEAIARQVVLLDPLPARNRVRVVVAPSGDRGWRVEVVSRDRPYLFAEVTGVLAEQGLDVSEAVVATWADGAALESFGVSADKPPDEGLLVAGLEAVRGKVRNVAGVSVTEVLFDDASSPWSTLCEIRAPDEPGLLHRVANAFASAGVSVHTASVATTVDSLAGRSAADRFEVTELGGSKLSPARQVAVRHALSRADHRPRGLLGRVRRS